MPEFLHAEPKRGALHASRAAPPFAPATTQLLGAIAQDRLVFLFVERRDQHCLSIRFSWFHALPPVLTRRIGRSLPHGPHQHHHRALNPVLGFSNDPGRDGFATPAVAAAERLGENNSTTSGMDKTCGDRGNVSNSRSRSAKKLSAVVPEEFHRPRPKHRLLSWLASLKKARCVG
jgi:hypothetical protein